MEPQLKDPNMQDEQMQWVLISHDPRNVFTVNGVKVQPIVVSAQS